MRVGKQFFHGGIFHVWGDASGHETREVGLGRELLGISQSGDWLGRLPL
jgi:hypothetical protein